MSNLPVRVIEEYVRRICFDPIERFKHDLWSLETQDKINRINAGELTAEEAFGPAMTSDEFRERYIESYYRENPGVPRKYRLPDRWHYVGDHDSQPKLGLDYGDETGVERKVSEEESSS